MRLAWLSRRSRSVKVPGASSRQPANTGATIEPFPNQIASNESGYVRRLTSLQVAPNLEMAPQSHRSLNGQSHQWGRHGFDGDACGQEACRGAHTRNRGQNDNCQSTDGIRSLTSLGSRPRRLRPWASEGRHTAGCSFRLRLGRKAKITG